MDDKQLTAGLSLLADELTYPDVDIDAAISTARLRTNRRQAIAATAAGTVLVIAAIATFVVTTDRGADDPVGSPPSCAPSSGQPGATKSTSQPGATISGQPGGTKSTSQPGATISGQPSGTKSTGQPGATISGGPRASTPCGPAEWKVDERATELTDQLAARANLFPGLRVERDDSANTRAIKGGPPPALEFGILSVGRPGEDDRPPVYTAFAKLTDSQGAGYLRIIVDKGEQSSASVPFQPCPTNRPNCTSQQFADGTTATWHTHIGDAMGWNQVMGAMRPDGTAITVAISVWPDTRLSEPTRPQVPLTQEQLYDFATIFTY